MTGYKGFNKDMTCRYKQYAEGKTYLEDKADLCSTGMHFCEAPHHVFGYYSAGSSVFHKVEAEQVSDKSDDDDSKRVCEKLTVGSGISAADICKIAVNDFFEWFGFEDKIKEVEQKDSAANAGDRGAATAGNCGAATAGNRGAATAGNRGAANAGDCGAATAGDCGAANAGDWGAANAGNWGAANAGNWGASTAGDYGAANAGDYGAATAGNWGAANAGDYGAANAGSRGAANAGACGAANAGNRGAATAGACGAAIVQAKGSASVGEKGVAVCTGNGSKAKGQLGSALVLIKRDDNYKIITAKAVMVNGKTYKPDTWYMLNNEGKVIKA